MRLLLVEDEKRMAQALCEILRLEKYEVDHFANGLEGLSAIESRNPEIARRYMVEHLNSSMMQNTVAAYMINETDKTK